MPYSNDKIKREWIASDIGLSKEAIDWAKNFGEGLAQNEENRKKLSTSQLRKFFGQLKRIQVEGFDDKNKHKLLMLKPQLAYAVGRDKNQTKIKYFSDELSLAIDYISNKNHFKNFVNLTEAIVAYHKSKGGE